MASPAGRGAQVRLDGDAQAAARGALGMRLQQTLEAKRVLEFTGAASDGQTPDGSTRTGIAAEDEVLAPGGAFLGAGGGTVTVGTTAGTVAAGDDPRITGALQAVAAAGIYATRASPDFVGTPTAPSPAPNANNNQIATMAAVQSAIQSAIGLAPAALDTLAELAAALANDANFATTVNNALIAQATRISTLEAQISALQFGGGSGSVVTYQDGSTMTFQDGSPVVFQ